MMKKYMSSSRVKINKNCEIQFNETEERELHIKIITFGKENVTLTEGTLETIYDTFKLYRDEVGNVDSTAS